MLLELHGKGWEILCYGLNFVSNMLVTTICSYLKQHLCCCNLDLHSHHLPHLFWYPAWDPNAEHSWNTSYFVYFAYLQWQNHKYLYYGQTGICLVTSDCLVKTIFASQGELHTWHLHFNNLLAKQCVKLFSH
jgi:hypothetical protein